MSEGGQVNVGEMIMHHTGDAYSIEIDPFLHWSWSPDLFPTVHLGSLAINLTPTKHVVFMVLTAVLVFTVLKLAANGLARQKAGERAPTGFAGMIEALVLWVRDDIAIANIGEEEGPTYAPLILTLFFFILFANLFGLVPWGQSATGNLAVTAGLAVLVFLTVEIGGMRKLGFGGYMGTIFMQIPGMKGPAGTILAIALAPLEILGKLTKPFALAVRLFGNMTAGHFVILSLMGLIFMFGTLGMVSYGIGLVTATAVLGIMCLELIVAFLQAYVFALLSSVFIGAMQHEHH
ncbi:MAG: F0F1 ATP synthase subunit A [Gemmatimonadales bacterium]|nr:F0F1 ATP synthase subunit A [Gemmatimonadales bacterium]